MTGEGDMRLMKGDMWKSGADVIVVTGNATVRGDGALVMGRGAAREARDAYPGIDLAFGHAIREWRKKHGPGMPYALLLADKAGTKIGLFQVKWHWADAADLELIATATEELRTFALTIWREYRIALNFPGIGNGRLARADVLPVISRLPDNVSIYERVEAGDA